jgi:hypothetical protein
VRCRPSFYGPPADGTSRVVKKLLDIRHVLFLRLIFAPICCASSICLQTIHTILGYCSKTFPLICETIALNRERKADTAYPTDCVARGLRLRCQFSVLTQRRCVNSKAAREMR